MQVEKKDTDTATAETCLKGVVYRWIKGWGGNTLLKRDANNAVLNKSPGQHYEHAV